MPRSVWKGPFLDAFMLRPSFIDKTKKQIWSRRSVIPGYLINQDVFVHCGNAFKKLRVDREIVGFKFGEFVPTRKPW